MKDLAGDVNSREYWNARFRDDWESAGGPAQTHFFATVALEHSPLWFLEDVHQRGLSVVDVGCATGQATRLLERSFPDSTVVGVDFAEASVRMAGQSFPDTQFRVHDLTEEPLDFDVVFLSNVLEHFSDPWLVLAGLVHPRTQYLWILVPFQDRSEEPEHEYTFDWGSLRQRLEPDFVLVYEKIVDLRHAPDTRWHGKQMLSIFTREQNLGRVAKRGAERRRPDDPEAFVLPDVGLMAVRLAQATHAVRREEEGRQRLEETLEETEVTLLAEREEAEELRRALRAERELSEESRKSTTALEAAVQEAREAIDRQLRERQFLEARVLELESRLSETVKATDVAENEVEELRLAYGALRRSFELEVQRAMDVVAAFHRSRSWSVTRPLRAGSRWLKRLLNRPGAYQHEAEYLPVLPPRLEWERRECEPVVDSGPMVQTGRALAKKLDKIYERCDGGRELFALAETIPWRVSLFQRPQHMSRALARSTAVVLYFTYKEEWPSPLYEMEPNLFIVTGHEMIRELRSACVSFYSTAYAHTPDRMIRAHENGNLLLYEYIDHVDPQISGHDNIARLMALKEEALRSADLIAASARELEREILSSVDAERVIYLPNGVDVAHYGRAAVDARRTVPGPMREIVGSGRPVIGYFGALAPWLWYEVLEDAVRANSELEFVFIGPDYYGGSKSLPAAKNVHWLGPVDYKDLPLWAQHFDVAIIPFRPGDVARTTSPLKLFEYFALRRPVVVSDQMLECTAFDEVLTFADAAEFSVAVEEALGKREDPEYLERLGELAVANSWDSRAEDLIAAIQRTKPVVSAR